MIRNGACAHRRLGTLLLLVTATAGTCCYYYYFYLDCSPVFSGDLGSPQQRRRTDVVPTILAFEGRNDDTPTAPDCKGGQQQQQQQEPYFPYDDEGGSEAEGFWHEVDSMDSEWYVYSVHVDRRLPDEPLVRIVAMSKGWSDAPLYCRWWYAKRTTQFPLSSTRARKQELWIRSWDSVTGRPNRRYYHPFLLSCPIPSAPTGQHPTGVSVVDGICDDRRPGHRFRLTLAPPEEKRGFVVCLKPLDFASKDISPRLLEWLELQHILGADRVHIYFYRLHSDTWRLLQHYERMGRVRLWKHTLPGDGNATVDLWQKRRHEMAVYNDCFYRHVNSHAFVVNLDLDEAIVPVRHDTWSDLLGNALAESATFRLSASLSVRNVYFFDSFGQIDEDDFNFLPLPRKQSKPNRPRELDAVNDYEFRGEILSPNSEVIGKSIGLRSGSTERPSKKQINHTQERITKTGDSLFRSEVSSPNSDAMGESTVSRSGSFEQLSKNQTEPSRSQKTNQGLRMESNAGTFLVRTSSERDTYIKILPRKATKLKLKTKTKLDFQQISNDNLGLNPEAGLQQPKLPIAGTYIKMPPRIKRNTLQANNNLRLGSKSNAEPKDPVSGSSTKKTLSTSSRRQSSTRQFFSQGHLHMLRHVIRSANFTPPGFAQKSFFSTQLAEAVSNHYALRAVRPDVRLLSGLGVESARLHHYRGGCPPLMELDCDRNYARFRVRDTLLWKYRDRLVSGVLQRMRELELLPNATVFKL